MKNSSHNRGMILLVVLGVLALMSILAITFVQMTRLEKTISQNYVDHTRAVLAAESGIDYAIARISQFQGGALSAQELNSLKYKDNPSQSGLEFATQPSFSLPEPNNGISGIVSSSYASGGDAFKLKVEDESGKLNLNDTDGLWNPHQNPNALSRLRVLVENLGDILFGTPKGNIISNILLEAREQPAVGGRFSSMRQVRDLLVPDILDVNEFTRFASNVTLWSWQDPNTIRPNFQLDISTPPGKENIPSHADRDVYLFSDWQTKGFELEPRAPVNVNTASRELLQALMQSLQGWYLREGPGETYTGTKYEPMEYVGGDYNWTVWHHPVIQYYHADNTQPFLTIDDNFITHESRFGEAVLTPLFEDIRPAFAEELAVELYHTVQGIDNNGDGDVDDPGDTPRNPLETWEEFEFVMKNILDTLLPLDDPLWDDGSSDVFWKDWHPGPEGYDLSFRYCGADAAFRVPSLCSWSRSAWPVDTEYWRDNCLKILLDLILANFNPNSLIQDYNPDRHIYHRIDKAHLTQYSTEFCFEPTGVFSIESLGVIHGQDNTMLASEHLQVVVRVFDIVRLTTQHQFMKGFADASGVGLSLEDYFTTPALSDETGYNVSLLSYPEPLLANDPGQYLRDSIFDGYLMCATNSVWCNDSKTFAADFKGKLEGEDQFGATVALSPPLENGSDMFVYKNDYRYDGTWDVATWDDVGVDPVAGWLPRNIPRADCLMIARKDQKPGKVPGILYPDGALSDAGRSLEYVGSAFGSDEARRGALHFWLKPNYDTQNSSRIRRLYMQMGLDYDSPIISRLTWLARQQGLFYLPHWGFHQDERVLRPTDYPHLWGQSPVKWANPCSLAFGWGYGTKGGVLIQAHTGSPTAVSDLPNREDGQQFEHDDYYFDPHQWTLLVLGWDHHHHRGDGSGQPNIYLSINGKSPSETEGIDHETTYSSLQNVPPLSFYNDEREEPNNTVYARFGTNEFPYFNYVADATFDEIVSYPEFTLSGPVAQFARQFNSLGRYYSPLAVGDTAVYLSPSWSYSELFPNYMKDAKILRSVSWTCYWPDYNEKINQRDGFVENDKLLPRNVNADPPGFDPDNPNDRRDDPLVNIKNWPEAFDPVTVDVAVVMPTGEDDWLSDSNADGDIYDDIANTFSYAGGSSLNFMDGAKAQFNRDSQLRFRVYFNVAPNQRLFESPVLDDITFTFTRTKPEFLVWNILK
ncbi:PilX N-terminal domain-containing pilus assembly protein [Planctomycetota bacterium]